MARGAGHLRSFEGRVAGTPTGSGIIGTFYFVSIFCDIMCTEWVVA